MATDRFSRDERERLEEFATIIRQAQRELAKTVELALKSGELETAAQRRVQIARVVDVLRSMLLEIDPRARRIVRDAFQRGAEQLVRDIGRGEDSAPEIVRAFDEAGRDALIVLEESIIGSLSDMTTRIGRQVDDVFRREGLHAATFRLLGVDTSREAATQRLVKRLLRDRRVATSVASTGTFKLRPDGRNWRLEDYAEMVVRTTIAEAVAQGTMLRMAAEGLDVFEWETVDPCPVCLPWSGRLISLSGLTKTFRGHTVWPYDETPGLPAHPRCNCRARIRRHLLRARRAMATAGA